MAWQLITFMSLVAIVSGRYEMENANSMQDWWETASIYQVYTRSFMDSNGDGIGDINGIISRLTYIKELQVDAIWLTPIFKSPLHDLGYDIADYYIIHPDYGTMEDFEHLLKKASQYDIKVILDLVPNHTSNESEWFLKSANRDEYYNDWYIWASGHMDNHGVRTPPNNWGNAAGVMGTFEPTRVGDSDKSVVKFDSLPTGLIMSAHISVFRKSAWTYVPHRDQYYLHQFGQGQPDLNYRNPVVVDEMKSVFKYWLEKGVAGLRMTSVNHFFEADKDMFGGRYPDEPLAASLGLTPDDYGYLNHIYTKDFDDTYDLISQIRDVFDAISVRDNMTRVLITEAATGIKNAVRYYGDGMHGGAHIPINLALVNDLNKNSDARDLKFLTDRWMTYKPLKQPANWMIGNQDKSRVASRFRPEITDAFNMIVLLLPGIAITYMGEELGMSNGFVPWVDTKDPLACNTDDPVNFVQVTRDPVRTPFHWSSGKNAGFSNADVTWLPLAGDFDTNNVAIQRSTGRSHYHVYQSLTALRRRPAFRYGRFESMVLSKQVFAFKRWHNDDTYVVVMNVGKSYSIVNLTAFDLVFGQLEVETSSVLSTRTTNDVVQANFLDLAADEALVLRMQV